MYYEESMIDGALHWRGTPNGKWEPCRPARLNAVIAELRDLAAQALQAAPEGGWKSIDSAPQDGAWVAARHLRNRPFTARYLNGMWVDENNAIRDPTHYVALPPLAAPSPTAALQAGEA